MHSKALHGITKGVARRASRRCCTSSLRPPHPYKVCGGPVVAMQASQQPLAGLDTEFLFAWLWRRQTSPLLWLARGVAILEVASMPILAEGDEEPNDTFREQLVASATAAVQVMRAPTPCHWPTSSGPLHAAAWVDTSELIIVGLVPGHRY